MTSDAWEMIGMGIMICLICAGCSTCNYVNHRINMEAKQMEAKL